MDQFEADSLRNERGLIGISRKYVDLTIDGNARLEIRTERLKNERCTPIELLDPNSGCSGGFKAPRFDTELSIVSGGLLARRLHVDVDYDTSRDFNAKNNFQIYYEGLPDEIVRRVEVGTVTFRPPASRFITASIPANNFGVNATFESELCNSRPSPRLRRGAKSQNGITRSAPRRYSPRIGCCATSTSRVGGSSGWWIPSCCPATPRSIFSR
jgi:hypothetical protein